MILDAVSRRYGKLPSQVMKVGDSLDMRCANLAISYESYLNKKAKGGHKDKMDHGLSTTDLQDMVKQVRGQKNDSKN